MNQQQFQYIVQFLEHLHQMDHAILDAVAGLAVSENDKVKLIHLTSEINAKKEKLAVALAAIQKPT